MRFFLVFLLFFSFVNAKQYKIIVETYSNEARAKIGFDEFKQSINDDFKNEQNALKYEVKIRKSGKNIILVIEPFNSYKEAKKTAQTFSKRFHSYFINGYKEPVPKAILSFSHTKTSQEIDKTQEELEQKVIKDEKDEIITQEQNLSKKEIIIPKKEEKIPKEANETKETNQTILAPKESNQTKKQEEKIEPEKIQKSKIEHPIVKPKVQKVVQEESSYIKYLFLGLLVASIIVVILAVLRIKYLKKQMQIQDELSEEKDKISDKLEYKISRHKHIIENLSHSIEEPLKTIDENLSNLPRNDTWKKIKKSSEMIQNAIKSYSDVQAPVTITPVKFDLIERMNFLFNSLQEDIAKQDNNIIFDYDMKFPRTFIADANKVMQIISTLLRITNNNVKNCHILLDFKKINDEPFTFEIEISTTHKIFSEEVSDLIEHILASYEDDPATRSKLMIDLFVSVRFIEKMQGSIELKNDEISKFICKIPLEVSQTQENVLTISDEGIKDYSVLIAENDVKTLSILRKQLEHHNINVKPCFSWEQVLKHINDIFFIPDIVFIQADLLEKLDEEELKLAKERKNFVTIFIINNQNNRHLEKLLKEENTEILLKPYTQDTLFSIMLKVLEKRGFRNS